MASVDLVHVQKAFGSVMVIPGIDLAIRDGEFVALVGPSGCGKSTLLRMIAGLEDITDGEIRFADAPVDHLSPRERNVAMVFQSYALYPHMTVRQNMAFNLKISGMARPERDRRVDEAAKLLEIGELLNRRPGQLSGGQRQRVAMGRAVVRDPAVFLFDEPLSNLDAKLRVQMRTEIKALHKKIGRTTIYVTHDQIEAMTMADRVVVLSKGRIEQAGEPMELYRRPANLFVAGFIGSPAMNLIDATVVADADGPRARLGDGSLLRLPVATTAVVGQSVVLGIRPEHVAPGDGDNVLDGQVLFVDRTGAHAHLLVAMAGKHVTAIVDGELDVRPDAPFRAALQRESLHVFDKATGSRL